MLIFPLSACDIVVDDNQNESDGDSDVHDADADGDADIDAEAEGVSGDSDIAELDMVQEADLEPETGESDQLADGDDIEDDTTETGSDSDSEIAEADAEEQDVVCVADIYCGNEDEYCWIYDEENSLGFCKKFCDLEDVDCPNGYACENGKCTAIEGYCTGDEDCDISQYCNMEENASDGLCENFCFVPGEMCPENTYCVDDPGDLNYGMCIEMLPVCSSDEDCEAPDWCYFPPGGGQGQCVEGCFDDDDCVGVLVCKDGKCVLTEGGGDCGPEGCPLGYICDPIYNNCMLNCPPTCPEGYSCNPDSAPDCIEGCTPPPGNICGFGMQTCCPPATCSVNVWVYGVVGICQ